MDRKSEQTLKQWTAQRILTDLVNVIRLDLNKPNFDAVRKAMGRAAADVRAKGVLQPAPLKEAMRVVSANAGITAVMRIAFDRAQAFVDRYGALRKNADNALVVLWLAHQFQMTWMASRNAEAMSSFVDTIFTPFRESAFYGESLNGAISASSMSKHGRFVMEPRDLLDAVGMEFLRNRNKLHRCQRPGCGLYFVKRHSRAKTCSTVCSEEIQRQRQAKWVSTRRQAERKSA